MATLQDLKNFLQQHAASANIDVGKPASLELIEKAQAYLGVRFPDDYREFLSHFGCLVMASAEVYGIVGEDFVDSSCPDAIWYTHLERKEINLPHRFVVL